MYSLLVGLLGVSLVSAHPLYIATGEDGYMDDSYLVGARPYYYPNQQGYEGYQAPQSGYGGHPIYAVGHQPVVQQTAVVQQQPIGMVQNQASSPTQIYQPAPAPPTVVNPSPVVVRPPPPPPIYVQPQKIFVQPPQVPPVYASNPQVYYAQGTLPGQGIQGGQAAHSPYVVGSNMPLKTN